MILYLLDRLSDSPDLVKLLLDGSGKWSPAGWRYRSRKRNPGKVRAVVRPRDPIVELSNGARRLQPVRVIQADRICVGVRVGIDAALKADRVRFDVTPSLCVIVAKVVVDQPRSNWSGRLPSDPYFALARRK